MRCYMFPGQGSQFRGMGGHLFDEFEGQAQVASEVLGYSIKDLCLHDTDGKLGKTEFTQPALFVTSALSYLELKENGGAHPSYFAGHSLGEYNALHAAGCFSFETGLRLVQKRGELMGRALNGCMVAVIGLEVSQLQRLMGELEFSDLDLANFNTPNQTVVSGRNDRIREFDFQLKAHGVRSVILNTGGAFHSRHMGIFCKEFEEYLCTFRFDDISVPVVSNVTARPHSNDQVKNLLCQQLSSPVLWNDSIEYLLSIPSMEFLEVGSGNVLGSMVDQIRLSKSKSSDSVGRLPIFYSSATGEEAVEQWNKSHQIGTLVSSNISPVSPTPTRSCAFVAYGNLPVVYLEGSSGFFALDDIVVD